MQRLNKFARLLGPTVVTMACALALRGQVPNTPEPTTPAAPPRDTAQRDTAQRDTAQREAAQREAAQRDTGQRDTGQRDTGQRQTAPARAFVPIIVQATPLSQQKLAQQNDAAPADTGVAGDTGVAAPAVKPDGPEAPKVREPQPNSALAQVSPRSPAPAAAAPPAPRTLDASGAADAQGDSSIAQAVPAAPAAGAGGAAVAAAATQPVVPGLTPPPTTGPIKIITPSTKPTTSKFQLKFQDASIDTILDYISEAAGFIIVKIGTIEGRVTVIAKQPVTPAEAVTLLNAALTQYGYTAVEQDGRVLKVMPKSMAVTQGPVYYGSDPNEIPATDDTRTQIIPVATVDAVKLLQDLGGMVSLEATRAANQGSNTIIITDRAVNVKRIVEIIDKLDKQGRTASTMKIYGPLKNASADDAAKLIQEIFKDTTTSGRGGSSSPFGFPGGPPGSTSDFLRSYLESRSSRDSGGRSSGDSRSGRGGGGEGGVDRALHGTVVAAADERTNTLYVTAPAETVKLIDQIIVQLDSDPANLQTFFIYNLRNAQAINLEPVLNTMFGASTSGTNRGTTGSSRSGSSSGSPFGSSFGSSGSSGFGGGSSGFGSSGGSRSGSSGFGSSGFGSSSSSSPFGSTSRAGGTGYGASRGTSSTGLGGSYGAGSGRGGPQASNELMGQVYVVANPDTNSLLVTTASKFQNQVRQIIEELDRAVPQVLIKVLVAEVTHENTADYGVDFSVLNSRVRTNADGTTKTLGQTGTILNGNSVATGGLVVQVLEEHVNATLHALAVNGKLDVLSRPYILASDNQQAGITVGQEVPFITNTRTDALGQQINTIQYQDIGIILNVIPHINPEGLVNLEVAPEISQLTGTTVPIGAGVAAPVIAKRSAYTYVSIRNGNTIVIGGLMEDRKTETVNKVPLLGDIPFLGQAFKRTQKDKAKTELLIFLTPHVALQPESLKPMSQDEMKGTKLTTQAVDPGIFEDHMRNMKRGNTENMESNKPYEKTRTFETPSDTQPTRRSFEPTLRGDENGPVRPRPPGNDPDGDRGSPRDQDPRQRYDPNR